MIENKHTLQERLDAARSIDGSIADGILPLITATAADWVALLPNTQAIGFCAYPQLPFRPEALIVECDDPEERDVVIDRMSFGAQIFQLAAQGSLPACSFRKRYQAIGPRYKFPKLAPGQMTAVMLRNAGNVPRRVMAYWVGKYDE